MSQLFPIVRPVMSQADLENLQLAAAADNHPLLYPSHIAEKDGQIIGYGGIVPNVAMVNVWIDSRKAQARDSVYCLNVVENLAFATGAKRIVMPCSEQSPFFPYMERFGYRRLGVSSVNLKG